MRRYADRLGEDTVAIFLLHGVIERQRHEVRNYTRKHIPLGDFEEFLDALSEKGSAASMEDVVAATRAGRRLPPRTFVITFDDGFENNASVAAPVLRRRKIPATFYVTSGFIDGNSSSWIDMIEYAVEGRPEVRLDLTFPQPHPVYRTRREKTDLLDAIRAHVKGHHDVDPYAFAAGIWKQLGVTAMQPDPDLDRKLTWTQVAELARDPLFIVGGHSHTHRIMAFLDEKELPEEIETSLCLMREHMGRMPTHYSYPEGLAHCYSNRVIDELKKRGIVCSPTAEDGVNRIGDDLFRLKRIMVE